MPPSPDRARSTPAQSTFARLAWMAVVGGVATALYAVLSWTAVRVLSLPIALASPIAYGLAAIWSFRGHRRLTFGDRRPHAGASVRFFALSLVGYGTASLIPAIASGWLGAPPEVSILIVCLAIPMLNYAVLSRHIFVLAPAQSLPVAAVPAAGPSAG